MSFEERDGGREVGISVGARLIRQQRTGITSHNHIFTFPMRESIDLISRLHLRKARV